MITSLRAMTLISGLLLCSAGLPVESHVSYTDTLWMARAVQGEVAVMGEAREMTGSWVAHVILNRADSKWFPPDIVSVVKQGFAGAHVVRDPHPWAWDIVKAAIEQRETWDPTYGSLFIIGGLDINDCMDWTSHRGSAYREGWVFSVHMFGRWPYIEGCVP